MCGRWVGGWRCEDDDVGGMCAAGNRIGDEGGKALGDALRENSSVTTLDLNREWNGDRAWYAWWVLVGGVEAWAVMSGDEASGERRDDVEGGGTMWRDMALG